MSGYDYRNRSEWEAWAWCWLGSTIFVVSLYLVPSKLRRLPRSHPSQIKARLTAVFCTSCATVLATCLLAQPAENGLPVRRWIGLGTNHLGVALVLPVLLTCCLFLGPLVTLVWVSHRLARNEVSPYGLSRPRVRPLPWHAVARAELVSKANLGAGTFGAIRNLVVGPIAEEVVFRGCSVPVLLGAGVSRTKIVWLSPLLFGFAHLHHALEWLRQGNSVRAVAVGMLFQIAYTSVFGAFAAFVQLRTGHLVSSILVHMLCNFMGVPDITFSIAPGNPGESTRTSVLYKHRKRLWCCYVVGIFLFGGLIRPLTSPGLYGSVLWSQGVLHG
ncbi:unnamed protein product [Ectocarpus sp. 6 AP-2014]